MIDMCIYIYIYVPEPESSRESTNARKINASNAQAVTQQDTAPEGDG